MGCYGAAGKYRSFGSLLRVSEAASEKSKMDGLDCFFKVTDSYALTPGRQAAPLFRESSETITMERPGGAGPAVFADMGITSTRKSTIKGHDQDVKVLNEFLGLKNMKLFSLDANSKGTISERDLCKVSMMGELATFLKEVKKNDVYRFKLGYWGYMSVCVSVCVPASVLRV